MHFLGTSRISGISKYLVAGHVSLSLSERFRKYPTKKQKTLLLVDAIFMFQANSPSPLQVMYPIATSYVPTTAPYGPAVAWHLRLAHGILLRDARRSDQHLQKLPDLCALTWRKKNVEKNMGKQIRTSRIMKRNMHQK